MDKGGDDWDQFVLPAIAEQDDPFGRAVGQLLWDEDPNYGYGQFLEENSQPSRLPTGQAFSNNGPRRKQAVFFFCLAQAVYRSATEGRIKSAMPQVILRSPPRRLLISRST